VVPVVRERLLLIAKLVHVPHEHVVAVVHPVEVLDVGIDPVVVRVRSRRVAEALPEAGVHGVRPHVEVRVLRRRDRRDEEQQEDAQGRDSLHPILLTWFVSHSLLILYDPAPEDIPFFLGQRVSEKTLVIPNCCIRRGNPGV